MNLNSFKHSIGSALKIVVFGQLLLMLLKWPCYAQSLSPYAYDIDSPSLVDYYIDPVKGSDFNNGTTQNAP